MNEFAKKLIREADIRIDLSEQEIFDFVQRVYEFDNEEEIQNTLKAIRTNMHREDYVGSLLIVLAGIINGFFPDLKNEIDVVLNPKPYLESLATDIEKLKKCLILLKKNVNIEKIPQKEQNKTESNNKEENNKKDNKSNENITSQLQDVYDLCLKILSNVNILKKKIDEKISAPEQEKEPTDQTIETKINVLQSNIKDQLAELRSLIELSQSKSSKQTTNQNTQTSPPQILQNDPIYKDYFFLFLCIISANIFAIMIYIRYSDYAFTIAGLLFLITFSIFLLKKLVKK